MTDFDNRIIYNSEPGDFSNHMFVPELKYKSMKSILTSILFIDKRKSIDPEMGAYISFLAAGLAAKEISENELLSREIKEILIEALANLATIPMILVTSYVDPDMITISLDTILANLSASLNEMPFSITPEQREKISSHETNETLGDIRDAVIVIEENDRLIPEYVAEIFTAGIKLSAKAIEADPLLNTAPMLESLTKIVVTYNFIVKQYVDHMLLTGLGNSLQIISNFNRMTLLFFNTLPPMTRDFEAHWIIPE